MSQTLKTDVLATWPISGRNMTGIKSTYQYFPLERELDPVDLQGPGRVFMDTGILAKKLKGYGIFF